MEQAPIAAVVEPTPVEANPAPVEVVAVVNADVNMDAPPVTEPQSEVASTVVAEVQGEEKKDEAEEEEGKGQKRATPDDPATEEGQQPPVKKQRVTQATVRKFLRKGKLLEHQLFTWRDWAPLDDAEQGDINFTGCKMKVEIKNAAGEVVLKPKQSVRHVELYTSKSMVIFYPKGSVGGCVICPLQLTAAPSLV